MADSWPDGTSMLETIPTGLGCYIPPPEMNVLLSRISDSELDSPIAVVGGLVEVWPARSMNAGYLSRFLVEHGMSDLSEITRDRLKPIRLDDGTVLLRELLVDFKVEDLEARRLLVQAHHETRRDVQDEESVLASLIAAIVILANQG